MHTNYIQGHNSISEDKCEIVILFEFKWAVSLRYIVAYFDVCVCVLFFYSNYRSGEAILQIRFYDILFEFCRIERSASAFEMDMVLILQNAF